MQVMGVHTFSLWFSERDESPGTSAVADFDPASPDVYFLVVKWYWTVEYLSQQLTEMYPLNTRTAILVLHKPKRCCVWCAYVFCVRVCICVRDVGMRTCVSLFMSVLEVG